MAHIHCLLMLKALIPAHAGFVQMFMLLHALPALTNQEAKCVGIFFSKFVKFVEVYRVSVLAAA